MAILDASRDFLRRGVKFTLMQTQYETLENTTFSKNPLF